jgi:hypothetical protein
VPELREVGDSLVACHLVSDDGAGPDVRRTDDRRTEEPATAATA